MFSADFRSGRYLGRDVVFDSAAGAAIYQGDILLGDAETLARGATAKLGPHVTASVISPQRLWPGGIIPYTIEASVPAAVRQRVSAAIQHWESRTPIRFIARAAQPDFVAFTSLGDGYSCSSAVGVVGGRQEIRAPASCTTGDIIHEIGHAAGLWHEQERADRNRYITVIFENIDRQYTANFEQAIADQRDLGPYDFNSIMHYGAYDFSLEGSPSIETVPAGIPIGQRVGLSEGDAAAVRRLYGMPARGVTIATTPSGLEVVVDGAVVRDGTRFDWAPGSKHTVSAREPQGAGRVRHVFGSWSDGGAASHEVTAEAGDVLLIINYVRQRQLTAAAVPAGAGMIAIEPASPDGYYTERAYVELTAHPTDGFSFLNWSASPSTGANPKQVLVNQPLDLTATFTTAHVTTIRSVPAGRTVLVDGVPVTTPRNFAWQTGEEHKLIPQDSSRGGVRHQFTAWTDGGEVARRIVTEGSPREFIAAFSVQYRLSVQSNSLVELAPAAPDGYYERGSQVRARIQARDDAAVVWTGDVSGALNPTLIVMDSVKAAVASTSAARRPTVISAASLRETQLAPGQVVTFYASGTDAYSLLGLPALSGSPATSANAAVTFDEFAAPVLSSSATHVTTVVPAALGGRAATAVIITWPTATTARGGYAVVAAAPALFTANGSGYGQALAFNEDAAPNSADRPARRGSVVEVSATGIGASPAANVTLRIAGIPAPLVKSAYGRDGAVARLWFQIPSAAPCGSDIPTYLAVDEQISPRGVTLAIAP
jgi:uncharacterized protein (TIGR03437 family)